MPSSRSLALRHLPSHSVSVFWADLRSMRAKAVDDISVKVEVENRGAVIVQDRELTDDRISTVHEWLAERPQALKGVIKETKVGIGKGNQFAKSLLIGLLPDS